MNKSYYKYLNIIHKYLFIYILQIPINCPYRAKVSHG